MATTRRASSTNLWSRGVAEILDGMVYGHHQAGVLNNLVEPWGRRNSRRYGLWPPPGGRPQQTCGAVGSPKFSSVWSMATTRRASSTNLWSRGVAEILVGMVYGHHQAGVLNKLV